MDSLISIFQDHISDRVKSWAVFEHGTCVIVDSTVRDVATEAKLILQKRGTAHGGSAGGDFYVVKLNSNKGWLVGYNDPYIFSYIGLEDIASQHPSDVAIGVTGRSKYNADATGLRVVYVKSA